MIATLDIRDSRGRFLKGAHWRKPQPFRDASWLAREYGDNGRSAGDIAKEFGVGETAILFWLKKHAIKTRTVSEARKLKRWGAAGTANPMFGHYGSRNPNWRGGLTPLRQQYYASSEWKAVARRVRKRDKTCRICGSGERTEIHHIDTFADAPLLNFDAGNLILLCVKHHKQLRGNERRWRRRLFALIPS